jgi:hypothetical protein
MRRIGLRLLRFVALGCLVVVSACTASQAGSPGSGGSSRLSPPILVPLDMSRFVSAPCTVLKDTQPIAHDVAPGVPSGNTCKWVGNKFQYPTYTVIVDMTSGGLEALYKRRAQLRYFEPTTITGFPAVFTDTDRPVANQGRCTLTVGVADDSVITVTSTLTDPKSSAYSAPCTDADSFAHAVIATIKTGNA